MRKTLVLLMMLGIAANAAAQQPLASTVTDTRLDPALATMAWTTPADSFEDALYNVFIRSEFMAALDAAEFPQHAIMAYTGTACPQGWDQRVTDDGEPLFYAFGLMVNEDGEPRSAFVRMPACVKE